jgi:hypothetical protein
VALVAVAAAVITWTVRGRVPDPACAPPDSSQQVPVTTPAAVSWSLFGGVAVPASHAAGPLITAGDVARCYAHTPTGALIASWQISTRTLVAHDWKQVTLAQVAPGPGRDAYLAMRARAKGAGGEDAGQGAGQNAGYAQVAGFRFISYTPQAAAIEMVTRSTAGQLQAYTLTVVWAPAAGGDWKLQLRDDGAPSTPARPLASLDGYTPWAGV